MLELNHPGKFPHPSECEDRGNGNLTPLVVDFSPPFGSNCMREKCMKVFGTSRMSFCLRTSPFGPVALLWSVFEGQPKIRRVLLSTPELSVKQLLKSSFSDSIPSACTGIDEVADRIEALLQGEAVIFSLDVVRLDLCSEFQRKVLRAEHGIPRGSISTYQRIARHLGRLSGGRAVGQALANNPFPIIVPCHRAICSDRTLGGYQGGLAMKRALLEMEGINFDGTGRITTEDFFY